MRAKQWMTGSVAALVLAAIIVSCGGTGGGGGSKGDTGQQFILNSNNSGRLSLNVNPGEVDANKSDRIGLVAVLSDSRGTGVSGVPITFSSDIDDITFIPAAGTAVTNASGRADIIAVAGSSPTGTGAIVQFGAIFAVPSAAFGLRAQVPITLLDVGFINADVLGVIPASVSLVEPFLGQVIFFNIVGGTPPYLLKNEVSGIGAAIISQHCLPGCTEGGGVLCIGSPCQRDSDCNFNGSPNPVGVCKGPIQRCLASCSGTNCGGSRCENDADCNDGSLIPANVCKDSGQSIAYIISENPPTGTHGFVVEDSAAGAVDVSVEVSFVCGNGTARGEEQCDLGDLRGTTCEDLGRARGTLACNTDCTFDVTLCSCGDGKIQGTEQCDRIDFGGATCEALGGFPGTLVCNDDCTIDVTLCSCGDGSIQGTEQCDRIDFGGATCEALGRLPGTLVCNDDCTIDVTLCSCGDGSIQGTEQCDRIDFGGATCEALGGFPGTLVCDDDCTIDVTLCGCGDGSIQGTEQCDLGDVGGATCEDFGRGSGNVTCTDECKFDFAGCEIVPVATDTPTPTPTITVTPTPTFTPAATPTPGAISNLVIAVGDPLTNVGADNNNNTATTVIAATASDGNGNPVEDGTVVLFGLTDPTFGALITLQSSTGDLPPDCDIANYQQRTGVTVLQQHGVAHACITYPIQSPRPTVTVQASSGSVTAVPKMFQLPVALVNPNPEPTPP